jgi:CheY-like chemotaxis protein
VKPWLVVEDEEDIRNIVKVMFQVWGHMALEFRDGNEAWTWLDSIESGMVKNELPELALMDIRMPGHRGHEIAKRMRSISPLQHIPIILMTAFSLTDSERQEMVQQYGVDHIVHKPLPDFFEFQRLIEKISADKAARTGKNGSNN